MQTAETDRMVGQVMRRLQEKGMYDDTLFVVTADHGMSFTPERVHPPRGHRGQRRPGPVGATVHQGPGQTEGQANERNWEHVDLVPTVAEMLGIKVPWAMDGVSQAGAEEPRTRTEKWFFSKPGERQEFPGPENHAKAMAGVTDQMTEPGNGYKGWFQFGPHGDLVGQRVSQVGVDQATAGSAKVEKLAEYGKVDLKSALVPARLPARSAWPPGPVATGGGRGPQRGDRRGVGDVPGGARRPGQPAERGRRTSSPPSPLTPCSRRGPTSWSCS